MSDFFKQLIQQLNTLWGKLSVTQKVVLSSTIVISFVGIVGLVMWSSGAGSPSGYSTLYSNLELEESGSIIEALKEAKVDYKVESNGAVIMVPTERLYEMRMQLAKLGLPKSTSTGYEIFDKTNLGQTDFVQKLNYIRATEGELVRTVESLDEVQKARIHIVIPKPTLFTEKTKDPTASIVLKLKPGVTITPASVKGIALVVASAVEGLKSRNISIMDVSGRLLSNPYGENDIAERSSHQIEIQQSVEKRLENKVKSILDGVLGVGKSYVKANVVLDFEKVEKTVEQYNPESKVVRSQERNEEQTSNSPQGDNRRENSVTNYEIDKTVQHIINAVGTIKKLSVSVAVNGIYKASEDGNREYVARTKQELDKLEDLVKAASGYDVVRGDRVVVTNMRFDNEFLHDQIQEMKEEEKWARYQVFAKYGLILVAMLLFILFVKYLAGSIVEALNPPVPEYAHIVEEELPPEEIPVSVKRTNEIMQRLEMLAKQEPLSVAQLIKTWLKEVPTQAKKK